MNPSRKIPIWSRVLAVTLLAISTLTVQAESMEQVLASKETPVGVVFEIVSNNPNELATVLPKVRDDIQRLRKRFPKLDIAVVSHGQEQFALTKKNKSKYGETNKEVQSLAADPNTTFHVCGTFAEMNNVSPEDFPDYVDVAAHGPQQIRTYMEFGYLKILVD